MKRYKCQSHGTILEVDSEGNRTLKVNFSNIGCVLPMISSYDKNANYGDCKIVEVGSNE